jgi:putative membrane protein
MLGCYVLGGSAGVILLSSPLLALVKKQPVISSYLFMGAIIACIPSLYRLATYAEDNNAEGFMLDGLPISPSVTRMKRVGLRPIHILGAVLGAAVGVGLNFIPTGHVADTADSGILSILIFFVIGIIIAIALVLPGISGSYVLLILGLYDEMLTAVRDMHILRLAPFIIGVAFGILATTKIIDYLMKRHPQAIFLVIIGFMIGSLAEVFPGLPHGIEIPLSIAAFAVGLGLIYLLGKFSGEDLSRKVMVDKVVKGLDDD